MKAVAVAILAIFAVAEAKVNEIWKCENVAHDACTVNQLHITPCVESPCLLKMGRNISTEVDFTPQFSSDKLKMGVYWVTPSREVTVHLENDACQYTTCPVNSGKQNTVFYGFPIPQNLITKTKFTFRFKIWNDADSSQVCCFETGARFY